MVYSPGLNISQQKRREIDLNESNRLGGRGRIDQSTRLSFVFNGKRYQGYLGDSLASALIANRVRLVGRSFKYHRPRGILTAGSEEPLGLVQLEEKGYTEPNTRATMIELYDGLAAKSQNCWPSVDFDIGSVGNTLSGLLVAGFYYKTFMHPASWWLKIYEKAIRKVAGMGKSPVDPDPDIYTHRYAYCDVLIVGAGPAGLAAAVSAGRSGARIIIADEHLEFGGSLLVERDDIDDKPAIDWVAAVCAELEGMKEATLLSRTTVTGCYEKNYFTALERVTNHLGPQPAKKIPRERLWKIRAKQVVIATGAIERPLVFADNDRPGTMLAYSVRAYINRFGVLPGREIVVFTNNDNAYRTALDVNAEGVKVQVVDLRPNPDGMFVKAAEAAKIRIYKGYAITGTKGSKALTGCEIAKFNQDNSEIVGRPQWISCDTIACSGGWNPAVHLCSQARGTTLEWNDNQACFVSKVVQKNMFSIGACKAEFDLSKCLAQGFEIGTQAAQLAGINAKIQNVPTASHVEESSMLPVFSIPAKRSWRGKKHFHDYQNDVTVADLELAVREGFHSVEHLKRYTTTGMGTDQGKTSNVNALALLSNTLGSHISELGSTTLRPPFTPVTFGAIAGYSRGKLYTPLRKTPMYPWHSRNGAIMEHVGGWLRPWAYPRHGEDRHAAVQRECSSVRSTVGMIDVSTLGKIEIRGPDAVTLLNRVYTNEWTNLPIGSCRYGVMLNEQGMVFDDGVTTRLGPHHYHMTTSSGGLAQTFTWLDRWLQMDWPELQVYLTNVTEQWAVTVISGPKAREMLQALTDIDLDNSKFPFMSYRECSIAGVPVRIFRISFSGELSYEINIPARYGMHVWKTLVNHGKEFGLCVYGTEALHVLRAERGFIVVGQDTDGTAAPQDLGMDWIVAKNKGDFLGRRSFACQELQRGNRKQLVGLLTEDPAFVLPHGIHIVENPTSTPPLKMLGNVTSTYMSPNLGHSIALAMIENGRGRIGETLSARTSDGKIHRVKLTAPAFYDPKGTRASG